MTNVSNEQVVKCNVDYLNIKGKPAELLGVSITSKDDIFTEFRREDGLWCWLNNESIKSIHFWAEIQA